MPPRITQESYRPRVSDRTMVGNAATVTLASFRNRRAPSRPGKWNHRDGREPCRFARRRATVSLGQATRRRERPFKQWGWMPRPKYLRHRAKGEIFLLTSPFIGLRRQARVMAAEPEGQPAVAPRATVAVGTTIADRPRTDPYERLYAYGSYQGCRAAKQAMG